VRIGHFTNCYKPRINGVVRSITVFRQALLDLGHEVHVFAPGAPGHVDDEPNIHRYPTLPYEDNRIYRIPLPFSPRLSRLSAELRLDVIHSHHPAALGWVAAHHARRAGIPLIYTLHSQYQRYGAYLPVGGAALTYVASRFVLGFMRACQRIIVPTHAVRDQIIQDAPDLAARIVVLPTPLPAEAFPQDPTRALRDKYHLNQHFTFAVASRLSAEKGLAELLEGFAALRRRRHDVRLLILGDGPEREELEAEAEDLHIRDAVVFAGMVPFQAMTAHLQAADAFVFASQVEAQGLVLNEAMAAGLPVVAYDAPFIRDIIVDGENGLLAKPHFRALAIKMAALIDDEDLRRRIALEGYRTAQRYTAGRLASDLVRVYQEAIDELHHDVGEPEEVGVHAAPHV
jgi:1,2-diacylglycerol 3-alpha-glucosyltransferase